MKIKSKGSRRINLLKPSEDLAQGALYKHFKVLKKIGIGNYSTVYEVERLADSGHYALKHIDIRQVDPSEYGDIVNELRLLASLDHPNLMTYFEAFVDYGGQLMVVTDLASGGDLGTLLEKLDKRKGWLPERQVWSYFLQLCVAVQYLHRNHVLHRDLKPHNVLITESGLLKIADMGISQMLDTVFTRALIGTPHYIAPEMWCHHPYSYSADIWALGCILHEMCTLRPLFLPPGRPTDNDIKARVLDGLRLSEPIPSRYSTSLWELVRRMLAHDPADRPTIDEILAMASVKAHMYLLPNEVQPYLDASFKGRATLPSMFRISVSADKWGQLNEVLPPSKYVSGGSVAESLRMRRPSSCPDLAPLAEGAGAGELGQGGPLHGGGMDSAWPASLFRVSAAYPVLKGIMAGEALRRASMGHALRTPQLRGESDPAVIVGAVQAPGSPAFVGKPRLRRSKSMNDVLRSTKRAAQPAAALPAVSCWPWNNAGPSQPQFGGGRIAARDIGGGGNNSGMPGLAPSAGSLWSNPRPAQPVWGGGLPPGNLSVIEQEPSDYNSSYHGGSYYGDGSYHGGGAGSYADNSYHGNKSIFDSSYHGAARFNAEGSYHGSHQGSYHGHDSSYHGNRSIYDNSYHGGTTSAFDSSYHGSAPRFSIDSSYHSGNQFSPVAPTRAMQAPAPNKEKKKKSGFKAKLKKFLYGDQESGPTSGRMHQPSSLW